MTTVDTVTWLADASNRDRLAELVHALTGRRLARTTMLRWMRGERRMDACAEALIAVLLTPVKDIRKADLELRKK